MTKDNVTQRLEETRQPMAMAQELLDWRWLIYGDKYIGKTTLIAKVVEELDQKALVISGDSSWTVWKAPEFINHADRIPWENFAQLFAVIDKIISGEWKYDWLILDPFSAEALAYISYITLEKPFKDQRDPDVPSWTHYGVLERRVVELMAKLRLVNINVCFITHQLDKDNETKIRSNLPPASWEVLSREVNLTGWIHKDKLGSRSRKIRIEPTDRVSAGTQLPGFPEGDYTIDGFIELVKANRTVISP